MQLGRECCAIVMNVACILEYCTPSRIKSRAQRQRSIRFSHVRRCSLFLLEVKCLSELHHRWAIDWQSHGYPSQGLEQHPLPFLPLRLLVSLHSKSAVCAVSDPQNHGETRFCVDFRQEECRNRSLVYIKSQRSAINSLTLKESQTEINVM